MGGVRADVTGNRDAGVELPRPAIGELAAERGAGREGVARDDRAFAGGALGHLPAVALETHPARVVLVANRDPARRHVVLDSDAVRVYRFEHAHRVGRAHPRGRQRREVFVVRAQLAHRQAQHVLAAHQGQGGQGGGGPDERPARARNRDPNAVTGSEAMGDAVQRHPDRVAATGLEIPQRLVPVAVGEVQEAVAYQSRGAAWRHVAEACVEQALPAAGRAPPSA